MTNRLNLVNKKYGRLTVIEEGPNKGVFTTWYCDCDCGKKHILARTVDLRRGNKLSCGCYFSEIIHQSKKKNRYDLSGSYGIGYTEDNQEFYFDLDDYNKIKNYYWALRNGYVLTREIISNKHVFMHRFLLNAPSEYMVDHINHNRADNRKENLRICNNQQNSMNRIMNPRNTSGYTGVYLNKRRNKWAAYIYKEGKNYHLGYFENKEDAAQARRKAELELFGEYSILNSRVVEHNE